MKIAWQLWLPWQPFIKNLNGISYETTEPILMKFHIKHLYIGCTKFSQKNYLLKFKMAAISIYGKNRSNVQKEKN